MEAKFGRAAARRPQVLVRARVPDRIVPALPGRQVRRVLRRQHLPADHQGARLFRSGDARPAATSRARWRRRRAASCVVVFTTDWRFRAGALARDREGAGRQPARRVLRRDRRAARPRRVPARRSAVPRRRARVLRPHRTRAGRRRPDTRGCRAHRKRRSDAHDAPAGARRRRACRLRDDRAAGSPTARACSTWAAATAPARVPARERGTRPATASRSTTPACSRACATAST